MFLFYFSLSLYLFLILFFSFTRFRCCRHVYSCFFFFNSFHLHDVSPSLPSPPPLLRLYSNVYIHVLAILFLGSFFVVRHRVSHLSFRLVCSFIRRTIMHDHGKCFNLHIYIEWERKESESRFLIPLRRTRKDLNSPFYPHPVCSQALKIFNEPFLP